MKFAPIVGLAVQAAGTVNGSPIPAQDVIQCSVQGVATGAGAAGTLKLQASNDNPLSGTGQVPTNWTDIPSATVAVSGAGSVLIPKTELCYQWIRVVYTNTGTGTIGANVKIIGF